MGIDLVQGYLFGKPTLVSALLSTELMDLHRQGYSAVLPTSTSRRVETLLVANQ